MLKLCVLSPATLEVMLNSYAVVPAYEEWMDSLPVEIHKVGLTYCEILAQNFPLFHQVYSLIVYVSLYLYCLLTPGAPVIL